jgi:hypothetical protein
MPQSPYGQARYTAFQVWRGPACAYHHAEADIAGGLSTLQLRMRQETAHSFQIESRAAYGGTSLEDNVDALLRATCWDTSTIASGAALPLHIPITYIRIAHTQVQIWMQRFHALTAMILPQSPPSPTATICTLRIETDSVSSVFEQTWVVGTSQHAGLQQAWNTVWDEMAQALEAGTAVDSVEESFDEPGPAASPVDWQTYYPLLASPNATP